jgi:hypothetical protein
MMHIPRRLAWTTTDKEASISLDAMHMACAQLAPGEVGGFGDVFAPRSVLLVLCICRWRLVSVKEVPVELWLSISPVSWGVIIR